MAGAAPSPPWQPDDRPHHRLGRPCSRIKGRGDGQPATGTT